MDKKQKASLLTGRTLYAQGHLDGGEYGYNDSMAINSAVDAIDMILKEFSDYQYIDKSMLVIWKEELKRAGREDAYTLAIAIALHKIANDINDYYNER